MEKKRIFIVDDEAGFTRLLKLTLEKTGNFQVLEENGITHSARSWNVGTAASNGF
jgi:CheY-like chemotaxis protein